jgi:hypothetical protein
MRTMAEIQVVPQGTLWVDIRLDPPTLAIRRQGGGLVTIDQAEVSDLIQSLALAALELQATKAGAEGYDESPIAGDPATAGNPDDFYDGGERHSDVW